MQMLIFSAKILAYMPYLMIKVLTIRELTSNDMVSFKQLGPIHGLMFALHFLGTSVDD